MATKRTFVHTSDEEINKKQKLMTPKNTIKSNTRAERIFQAYLADVGEAKQMLDLEVHELDRHLAGFWFSLRKVPKDKEDGDSEPQYYKTSTLDNIKYALKRYLQVCTAR